MKCASFVTETMLASRQLSKVSRGIRNNVVKRLKYYSTKWLGIDRDIELDYSRQKLDFKPEEQLTNKFGLIFQEKEIRGNTSRFHERF
jgi:hypothetical protein